MAHSKQAWRKFPIMRTERSGTMNDGEDNQLLSIQASKFEDTTTGTSGTSTGGEDYAFGNPLRIYKYKVELATNFMGFLYQTIGAANNSSALSNWNSADRTFTQGLKNVKMCYGESGSIQKVVMSFHSRRGIPLGAPGASGWDWFNISVHCNHQGASNRDYLAKVSLWYRELT